MSIFTLSLAQSEIEVVSLQFEEQECCRTMQETGLTEFSLIYAFTKKNWCWPLTMKETGRYVVISCMYTSSQK